MDITRLRRDGARVVAVARLGVGVSMLAAPTSMPRLLGVDRGSAERVAWLARMGGARELALGAGTLHALRRGEGTRPWLLGSAVCDAVDAVVLGAAAGRRQVHPVLGFAVAAVAAASAAASALDA